MHRLPIARRVVLFTALLASALAPAPLFAADKILIVHSALKNETRPALKAFAMGYLEGVREVYRNEDETIKTLAKYTRITDPQVLSASYDEAYQAIEKEKRRARRESR